MSATDRRPATLPFPGREAGRGVPSPSRARRTYSRGALIRRRWLIRATKWLLPVAALALLSVIALWPEFDRAEDRARVSFRRVTQGAAEAVRVVRPRYQGLDQEARPYNVTADTAAQTASEAPIALEKPRADIFLSGGDWALLESNRGRYDRAAGALDLSGDVTLWRDDGTTVRTASAQVDVNAGRAQGDEAVAAQGPFGTLTADGFRLEDRGKIVVFTGNAHAILEGSR